jgi:hypothetical protein
LEIHLRSDALADPAEVERLHDEFRPLPAPERRLVPRCLIRV